MPASAPRPRRPLLPLPRLPKSTERDPCLVCSFSFILLSQTSQHAPSSTSEATRERYQLGRLISARNHDCEGSALPLPALLETRDGRVRSTTAGGRGAATEAVDCAGLACPTSSAAARGRPRDCAFSRGDQELAPDLDTCSCPRHSLQVLLSSAGAGMLQPPFCWFAVSASPRLAQLRRFSGCWRSIQQSRRRSDHLS